MRGSRGRGSEGGGGGGGGGRERPEARAGTPGRDIVWRNVFLMSLLHLAAVIPWCSSPKPSRSLLWGENRFAPLSRPRTWRR